MQMWNWCLHDYFNKLNCFHFIHMSLLSIERTSESCITSAFYHTEINLEIKLINLVSKLYIYEVIYLPSTEKLQNLPKFNVISLTVVGD